MSEERTPKCSMPYCDNNAPFYNIVSTIDGEIVGQICAFHQANLKQKAEVKQLIQIFKEKGS